MEIELPVSNVPTSNFLLKLSDKEININFSNNLGNGTFGKVFKGTVKDNSGKISDVSIKIISFLENIDYELLQKEILSINLENRKRTVIENKNYFKHNEEYILNLKNKLKIYFFREVHSLICLKNCKNVLQHYFSLVTENFGIIFTEYIKGIELFDFITKKDNINLKHILYIFLQIFYSIKDIHKNGFYHGDLKLENILIDSSFNVTLIDFGFSNNKIDGLLEFGSLDYVSPQRYTQCNLQKNDIWSIGIILFIMIFKFSPFLYNDEYKIKTKSLLDKFKNLNGKPTKIILEHYYDKNQINKLFNRDNNNFILLIIIKFIDIFLIYDPNERCKLLKFNKIFFELKNKIKCNETIFTYLNLNNNILSIKRKNCDNSNIENLEKKNKIEKI